MGCSGEGDGKKREELPSRPLTSPIIGSSVGVARPARRHRRVPQQCGIAKSEEGSRQQVRLPPVACRADGLMLAEGGRTARLRPPVAGTQFRNPSQPRAVRRPCLTCRTAGHRDMYVRTRCARASPRFAAPCTPPLQTDQIYFSVLQTICTACVVTCIQVWYCLHSWTASIAAAGWEMADVRCKTSRVSRVVRGLSWDVQSTAELRLSCEHRRHISVDLGTR